MMNEAEVLGAFLAWAQSNGFAQLPARGDEDAILNDRLGLVIVEAKGNTTSRGTDIDTLYGQLLRRMHPNHPMTTRYAAVVPSACLEAICRVSAAVRAQLRIDVYTVGEDGTIDSSGAAPRR